MSKHLSAGTPGAIRPDNDLDRNPGIGASKGMTMAGADPQDIEADSTFEGDVENDLTPNGAVDSNRTERTNK